MEPSTYEYGLVIGQKLGVVYTTLISDGYDTAEIERIAAEQIVDDVATFMPRERWSEAFLSGIQEAIRQEFVLFTLPIFHNILEQLTKSN